MCWSFVFIISLPCNIQMSYGWTRFDKSIKSLGLSFRTLKTVRLPIPNMDEVVSHPVTACTAGKILQITGSILLHNMSCTGVKRRPSLHWRIHVRQSIPLAEQPSGSIYWERRYRPTSGCLRTYQNSLRSLLFYFGWEKKNRLVSVFFRGQMSSDFLQDLVCTCKGKSVCLNGCMCFEQNLSCTDLCPCQASELCRNVNTNLTLQRNTDDDDDA
jgi:hypothetical protein